MRRSLDGLITYILEEIAVSGDAGASLPEILRFICDYYTEPENAPAATATAEGNSKSTVADAEDEPAARSDDAGHPQGVEAVANSPPATRVTQKIDRLFQAKVWHWLISHPDITTGDGKKCPKISLDEAEGIHSSSVGISMGTDATLQAGAAAGSQFRLRVTEERIWIALTGHGVDLSRCPRLEFACLCAIAAHRETGVAQTDLTTETGQDKRSLPRRTYELARKGYIEKKVICYRKQRTSHLRLRRYADCAIPQTNRGPGSQSAADGAGSTAPSVFEAVEAEPIVRALFSELRERQIVTQSDLKWKLGIGSSGSRLGVYRRLLRKMELVGCLRRVRASSDENAGCRFYSCIKFIREPAEDEWRLPWNSSVPVDVSLDKEANGEQDLEDDNQDLEEPEEARQSTERKGDAARSAGGEKEHLREVRTVLPQWAPHRPLGNLLRDLVETSGIEGISTMALKAKSVGRFYNKPLEAALDRYSNFKISQPPHLRHMSIVRDTAQRHKNYHFQHYTFDNFKRLVQSGEVTWEAVIFPAKDERSQKGKDAVSPEDEYEKDEYGFPIIPSSRFTREDGCASLEDSVVAAQMAEIQYNSSDPMLFRNEDDGEYDVNWGIMKGALKMTKKGTAKTKPTVAKADQPRRPRGRPRKNPPSGKDSHTGQLGGAPISKVGDDPAVAPAPSGASAKTDQPRRPRGRPRKNPPPGQDPHAGQLGGAPTSQVRDDPAASPAAPGASVKTDQPRRPRGRPRKNPPRSKDPHTGQLGGAPVSQADHNPAAVPTAPEASEAERQNLKRTADQAHPVTNSESRVAAKEPSAAVSSSQSPPKKRQKGATARKKPVSTQQDVEATHETASAHADGTEQSQSAPSQLDAPATQQPLVTINPPGYKKPKSNKRGRPKKACIVVIKSKRLIELPGFGVPTSVCRDDSISAGETAAPEAQQGVAPVTHDSDTTLQPASGMPVTDEAIVNSAGQHGEGSKAAEPIADVTPARQQDEKTEKSHGDTAQTGLQAQQTVDKTKKTASGAPSRRTLTVYQRGSISFKRKQIVLDLIEKGNGVFPGDRELWYAFSILWLRKNKESGTPDLKTVKTLQKTLIDSGHLKSFLFGFTNSRGLQCEKRILARLDIQPSSPVVKSLEQKMKDADPSCYIPPESGVSAEAKRRFELSGGNTHGYMRMPKIDRDNTSIVTLMSRPGQPDKPKKQRTPAEGVSEREKKRLEQTRLRRQKKEGTAQQKAYKKSLKLSKQIVRLTMNEQRDAARKIEMISKSMNQLQRGHGPPRVARLHGLHRPESDPPNLQQGWLRQNDASLAEGSGTSMQMLAGAPGSNIAAMLMPLTYKLHRTSLSQCKQVFYPSNGTFGTFYQPMHTGRKRPRELSQYPEQELPQSLDEILAQTHKRRKVDSRRAADPVRSRFEDEVERVQEWEERHMSLIRLGGPLSWAFINHIVDLPEPGAAAPLYLRWKRPMGKHGVLDASEVEEEADSRAAKRRRTQDMPVPAIALNGNVGAAQPAPSALVPRTARVADPGRLAVPSRASTASWFKTRRLTALPVDESLEFNVGEAGAPQATAAGGVRKRRPRARGPRLKAPDAVLSEQDIQKLLVAVTVVRSLTGGLARSIDWVIVAGLFPHLTRLFLNRKWATIATRFRSQMDKLQADFQEAFLAAYEKNEVPALDYDNLVNYDWARLVDWAMKTLDVPESRRQPNLPAQRELLYEFYNVLVEPKPTLHWRDECFLPTAPLIKRTSLVNRNMLSTPLAGITSADETAGDEDRLARSWVRANIITSEQNYRADEAKRKLLRLGEERVSKALAGLCSQRIVSHANKSRPMPGRSYDITETFLSGMRKGIDEKQYAAAAAYKLRMDDLFRRGEPCMYSYIASDGETLAVLNLVAQRRVRLQARNVPHNKFGLMDGSYRTRFMDKQRLRFGIEVVPTEGYYVEGNPLLTHLPAPPHKHLTDETVPIPVWFDIHGNFVPIMWRKVLAAVLNALTVRAGTTVSELARVFRQSVEKHELELLLDWLVAANVVGRIEGGGYLTKEWWWMVLP